MKRILSILVFVAAVQTVVAGDAQPGALAVQLNDAFASVYERVAPAVVVIEVLGSGDARAVRLPSGLDFFFRTPDGRRMEEGPEQGSGFLINPEGYILTNNHVVENGERGKINVTLQDGRKFPGKLIGRDEKSDLAVIKIEATGLPSLELGDSDAARVGEFAFAIGAPFDLPYTFTVGVISAKGRTNLTNSSAYEEFIQTDASINPGNSGGPLCDLRGRVLGVNTLISGTNRGLGFAVPINIAKDVSRQLIEKGRVSRPWLGIGIVGLEEDARRKSLFPGVDSGVLVESIEPGTPAYSSDLQPGDVILKVDGKQVAYARDLQKEILTKAVGQSIELQIWRSGKVATLGIRTGEQPDQLVRASNRMIPVPVAPPGIDPAPLPQARATPPPSTKPSFYGLIVNDAGGDRGVLVEEVLEGSPAEVAGLEVGDVIDEMAGTRIRNRKDFSTLVQSADIEQGAMILLERDGQKTFAILKP